MLKKMMHLAPALKLLGIALALAAAAVAGLAFWYFNRPLPEEVRDQPLFEGVTYTREIRREPHKMIIHVVKIDLDAPGIRFLVTPGDFQNGRAYKARTTSQFLDEFNVQLAINGDSPYPWSSSNPLDFYPREGDPVDARGITASRGKIITQSYQPGYVFPTIYITQDNRVSFNQPIGEIYDAISGLEMIVEDGHSVAVSERYEPHEFNPRTAIALDKSGRILILVQIDGRQPNYSDGATLPELADVVIKYGGYTSAKLDGGGSTALIIEGKDGRPVVLNSPVHTGIPGRERPIANHLGVFANRIN
jgi:hypothetical protein